MAKKKATFKVVETGNTKQPYGVDVRDVDGSVRRLRKFPQLTDADSKSNAKAYAEKLASLGTKWADAGQIVDKKGRLLED